MLKQPDPTLHKTTRTEITVLFGDAKLFNDAEDGRADLRGGSHGMGMGWPERADSRAARLNFKV